MTQRPNIIESNKWKIKYHKTLVKMGARTYTIYICSLILSSGIYNITVTCISRMRKQIELILIIFYLKLYISLINFKSLLS